VRGSTKAAEPTAAEQRLLTLLLDNEELRQGVLPILATEDYEDLPTAAIFEALLKTHRKDLKANFDSLNRMIEGDALASELLYRLSMSSSLHSENEHYTPEGCVHAFRLMKVEHQIEVLRAELATAERAGDSERVLRLSTKQTELAHRRNALFPRTEAALTSS
jgi:hypothetical protein